MKFSKTSSFHNTIINVLNPKVGDLAFITIHPKYPGIVCDPCETFFGIITNIIDGDYTNLMFEFFTNYKLEKFFVINATKNDEIWHLACFQVWEYNIGILTGKCSQ